MEDTMDLGDQARRAARLKAFGNYVVILIHHAEDGEDSHVITASTNAADARSAVETVLASDVIRGYDPGDFQEVVTVRGDEVETRGPTPAWWPRYDGTYCRTHVCENEVDVNAGTDYCEACTAYENQEPHA